MPIQPAEPKPALRVLEGGAMFEPRDRRSRDGYRVEYLKVSPKVSIMVIYGDRDAKPDTATG